MTTIGFLHTSSTHVERFEALVRQVAPDMASVSIVQPELLTQAIRTGPGADEVLHGLDETIAELEARGSGVIVCTCSTLGAQFEQRGAGFGVPVLRGDRPMAEAAVLRGSRIAVVASLQGTLAPTRVLLEAAAAEAGRSIVMSEHLLDGAWQLFLDGYTHLYLRQAAAMCDLVSESCDVVVLAQASMVGAAHMALSGVRILDSPGYAVRAAVEAVRGAGVH